MSNYKVKPRWKKGQSGNPGGRPKTAHIRDLILAQTKSGTEIVAMMLDFARNAKHEQTRFNAGKWLGDYAFGKPVETHNVNFNVADNLREGRARVRAALDCVDLENPN